MKEKEINILEQAKKQEKAGIDRIREEYKPIIQKIRTIEKLKKSKRKNTTFFVNANSLTCYQSLAFCCDIIKPCIWRSAALKLLGISDKEFKHLKDRFTRDFLKKFKEKNKKVPKSQNDIKAYHKELGKIRKSQRG